MNDRRGSFISIVSVVLGAIGACGQAYLLHHELVDSLPYKIVDVEFHQSVARTGIWLAPLTAILIGALFVRKRFWLSLVLPDTFSPFLFAVVYKAYSTTYGLIIDADAFGDFTTAKAAQEFYLYRLSLTATGFIIGAALALLLLLITKNKELA